MRKKPGPVPLPTKRERRAHRESVENKILTILSMNGRASFNMISSMLGVDKATAYRKVKALEKKYKIRYIAEIDTEKLGFLNFVMLVKFLGKAPDYNKVMEAVESLPQIQFGAAMTGGEYDYLFYALVETNLQATLLTIQLHKKFGEFECELHMVPFYETYGFVPLRDVFIDTLKERVFKRQKESITKKHGMILQREFAVLKELNRDGSAEFTEIDKKYGFDQGRSQYSYYRMLQEGLLKRITISMDVPLKYMGVLFMKITKYEKFSKTRVKLLQDIIAEGKGLTNRYLLVGDINSPNGGIFFLPCTEEGDLERYKKSLDVIKGVEISASVITKRIIGDLCFRRFDNAHSTQANVLEEEYKIKNKEKIDYGVLKSAKTPGKEFTIDLKDLK
ncbi:MAG: Lrp/AsnC family transcriptional regulator [Candidatus Micrarchaeia archaeon]